MSDLMSDRYGTVNPMRRRVVIAVSGVVGVVALAWLAWAAWSQSTPQVQSALRSYDVVNTHQVRASIETQTRSKDVVADCVVRAYGSDHSTVGEVDLRITGLKGTHRRTVTMRTERQAVSVDMVGCTAKGQSRPR